MKTILRVKGSQLRVSNTYKSLQDDEQQTEPPPRAKFSDTVTQFVIYDAYVTYEAEKEALEEQDRKGKSNEQNKYKRLLGETQVEPNDEANESLLKSARILERMVNQNTFNLILTELYIFKGPNFCR